MSDSYSSLWGMYIPHKSCRMHVPRGKNRGAVHRSNFPGKFLCVLRSQSAISRTCRAKGNYTLDIAKVKKHHNNFGRHSIHHQENYFAYFLTLPSEMVTFSKIFCFFSLQNTRLYKIWASNPIPSFSKRETSLFCPCKDTKGVKGEFPKAFLGTKSPSKLSNFFVRNTLIEEKLVLDKLLSLNSSIKKSFYFLAKKYARLSSCHSPILERSSFFFLK